MAHFQPTAASSGGTAGAVEFTNGSFVMRGGYDYVENGSDTELDQGDVFRKAGSQTFLAWDDSPQFKIDSVVNAKGYFQVQGAIADVGPCLVVRTEDETETNLPANYCAFGPTGAHNFGNGSGLLFSIEGDGSGNDADNYFSVRPGASGADPRFTSTRGAEYSIATGNFHRFMVNGQTHFGVQNIASETTTNTYWTASGRNSATARFDVTSSNGNASGLFAAKGTGGIFMVNGGGTLVLFDSNNLSAPVNSFIMRASQTGLPIQIRATGSDTNIDVEIVPQGTGVFKYGTHSAIGAETVTGYITIKDSGGTTRKLAVVS